MKQHYCTFPGSAFVNPTLPHYLKQAALFLLLLLAGFGPKAYSQSVCNYSVTGPNPGVTIDAGGVSITLGDNQVSGALPVGFNFSFFGNTYSQFYISSNGFITFDVASPDGCCTGQSLPQPGTPNNLVAAAWQNLNPAAGGTIGYNTFGSSPNRRLVISFNQVMHFGGANPVTFQIKLFETSNRIEIHTISQPANTAGHTMGLENAGGTVGVPVSGRNSQTWTASNETVIFQPIAFTLNTTQTNLLCNSGGTGVINVSTTGGNGSLTYSINNGSNYQAGTSFTGLAAGPYQVIARDVNGCTTQMSPVTLTEPPALVVNAGPDTAYCAGGSMVIPATASGGTGALTYSWSPTANLNNPAALNPTASPPSPTTYLLTVTDANNCTKSDSLLISVNPVPSPSFNGLSGPVCSNTSAQALSGLPTGGTFSGPGIAGTNFSPSLAGGGTHTITYSYTNAFNCSASSTQNVTVYAAPVAAISGLNANYCAYDPVVNLTLSPSGGSLTGAGTAGTTFDPGSAGLGTHLLTYTYTDANSCSDTTTASTTVNGIPTAFLSGLLPNYCQNSTPVTMVGNPGGGTFSGSGVSGNQFDPAAAGIGTHTLSYVYTNASGCSDTAYQTVNVNAQPTVSFSGLPATMCSEDAPVTLTGSPANGAFTGPGTNGVVFDPIFAGVGTHTVNYAYTDAFGCSNSSSQNVTVNQTPTVGFTGINPTYCVNDPAVTLTLTPASGGLLTGPGITGNDFDPALAGPGNHTLSLSYTDPNGCSNSFSNTVTVYALPVVNLGNDTSFCVGGSVTLDAGNPGSTYAWNTGPVTQTISVNATGTFYVDVVNAGGCAASDTIQITTLAAPVVNLGPDQSICQGNTVLVDAGNPGCTYLWTPGGQNTQTITVSTSGTYNVTVVNANNCSAQDAITITVMPLPIVNLGPDLSVCAGAPVTLNAGNPGSTYLWSTNAVGQSIQVTTSGSYWVRVTSPQGCVNSDTVQVTVISAPVAAFTVDTSGTPTILFTDNSTGNPTNWAWTFGDGGTSNSQNPSHTYPNSSGNYTVTLTVTNQCGANNFSQIVHITGPPVGIEAAQEDAGLTVYPNPANTSFRLKTEGDWSGKISLALYDENGRLILSQQYEQGLGGMSEEFNVSNLPAGMYFLKAESAARVLNLRIAVKH